MKHFIILALSILFLSTPALAQVLPPDAIARFHINEANYYADVGKYLEAVENLESGAPSACFNDAQSTLRNVRAESPAHRRTPIEERFLTVMEWHAVQLKQVSVPRHLARKSP